MKNIIAVKAITERDKRLIIPYLESLGGVDTIGIDIDYEFWHECDWTFYFNKEDREILGMFVMMECDIQQGVPLDFNPE